MHYSTAILWNLETGKQVLEFDSLETKVSKIWQFIAFSEDGLSVAVTSSEAEKEEGCVWNVETGQVRSRHPLYGAVVSSARPLGKNQNHRTWWTGGSAVAIHPTKDLYAFTQSEGNTVKLVRPTDSPRNLDLVGHTGTLRRIVFHPSEPRLFTAGVDGVVKLWDTKTGTELLNLAGSG